MSFIFFYIFEYLIAFVIMNLDKIFSPEEFFVPGFCLVDSIFFQTEFYYLIDRDDAMSDIGWEFWDSSIEIVARLAVFNRIKGANFFDKLGVGEGSELSHDYSNDKKD